MGVTDAEAMESVQQLSRSEGIIPALEPAHAIHYAIQLARERDPADALVVNLSGRGDKDMTTIADAIGVSL